MNNQSAENTEIVLTETTSASARLQTEIDEMRRRLAALEARAPAHAGETVGRKRHWRANPKGLGLMIAGVMLAAATIVFGQSAVDALFVSKEGKVGIGTTAPVNKLSVQGAADVSDSLGIGTNNPGTSRLKIANSSGDFAHFRFDAAAGAGEFEFAGWANGWNINSKTSGKNLYLNRDTTNSDVLIGPLNKEMIVKSTGDVGIGTTKPQAKLHVAGTLISQGRYQRDDSPETTYEVSPRYHLSLTATAYTGRTRQIPQQVINDLCADQDGCQFRLGMTRWSLETETETASITGLFYYSTINGHWRTSMLAQQGKEAKAGESIGVDGNKKVDHVGNAWDTCYFTDSPYAGSTDQGDPTIGMYLLVWIGGFTNPGRTCELTLID